MSKQLFVRQVAIDSSGVGDAQRRDSSLQTSVGALDRAGNIVGVAARVIKVLGGGTFEGDL